MIHGIEVRSGGNPLSFIDIDRIRIRDGDLIIEREGQMVGFFKSGEWTSLHPIYGVAASKSIYHDSKLNGIVTDKFLSELTELVYRVYIGHAGYENLNSLYGILGDALRELIVRRQNQLGVL